MMRILGRRVFVTLLAAVAAPWRAQGLVMAASPAAQGTPADIDAFLALSSRLTVHAPLDPGAGRLYLDALVTSPARHGLLLDLLDGRRRGPAHSALERDIVESWYTGVYEANGERRVATHGGALVWKAIGRSAPGVCAGMTGDWARPPGAGR
jgi:hypothetical protein